MSISNFLLDSVIYFEAVALIIGLIFAKEYWGAPSGYILIYLGLVLGIEFIELDGWDNHVMYNLLAFSELLIMTFIFYKTVKEVLSKKIIITLSIICILFVFGDFFLVTKTVDKFLSFGYGLTSIGISFMCFVYLFEMTNTEKVLNQNRILLFWICIGLLIFHLCNLPITVLINDLFDIDNFDAIYSIQSLAGILMYCCFITGFIWSKRAYNF